MAEISNAKTWAKTRLTATGSTAENAARILFERIYKHLVANCGWACVATSNGVDSAGAGDRITADDPAHLVPAAEGINHSWVLLQNDHIATGFQVLWNFTSASSAIYCDCTFSLVGFTGGSLTNAPTSTFGCKQAAIGWKTYVAATTVSANVFSSSDYQCTRIFMGPTTVTGFMIFDRPHTVQPWYTAPNFVLMSLGSGVYADFGSSASQAIVGSNRMSHYVWHRLSASMAGAAGDNQGAWPVDYAQIQCSGVPRHGHLGHLQDLWFVLASLAVGDAFPGDGSRQQIVIGNLVLGNDGTALTL
jgi:hypothetical protein